MIQGQRSAGPAAAKFEAAIRQKMSAGMDRPTAIRAVVAERPDLHRRYIAEHNDRVGPASPFRGERA